jgi:acetoin:2,6-dichlorophenolindophenol oxidoreductase subunit beta
VAYLEHKELWGLEGEVDTALPVPLGRARIARAGRDLTLVTWARTLHESLAAANTLAGESIEVEVIDLRTLWPWDRDAVLTSCAKTHRLLVAHEAVQAAGFGAEIAASVAEAIGCPVKRLGAPRIPVGYAPTLESEARVGAERIATAARAFLQR